MDDVEGRTMSGVALDLQDACSPPIGLYEDEKSSVPHSDFEEFTIDNLNIVSP